MHMSLTFIGPAGSCELPWIQYALLYDNIEHHLKGKQQGAVFTELHRVGEALGGRSVTVSASGLASELQQAKPLCDLPGTQLALSLRTKTVLFNLLSEPSPCSSTELIGPRLRLPWVPSDMSSLGSIFEPVITRLLAITQDASDTDQVEIIDS
jgi:hypothetical protein